MIDKSETPFEIIVIGRVWTEGAKPAEFRWIADGGWESDQDPAMAKLLTEAKYGDAICSVFPGAYEEVLANVADILHGKWECLLLDEDTDSDELLIH